ncbi:MAG TPA: hypothetical protein VFI47_11880 [Acidimicrobiales bacterium]|nr:hypothetical protein [Acidimicrobiales bacterium]
MDWVITVLTGAAAGFLAALIEGYFSSRAKVDDELHASRTTLYQELWRESALLPLWPRDDEVTYGALASLSARLRDWYFGTGTADGVPGGLYLSRGSRRRYGKVQSALEAVSGRPADAVLSRADYDAVRTALSGLRTQMTGDLLSRRGAPFRIA